LGSPQRQRNGPFKPTWEIGASIGVHVLVLGLIWVGQFWQNSTPLFDPKDVMAVQAVALPKANKRMPDRPSRTAAPPKGDAVAAKKPPPPKTASDMAHREKKAAKRQGAPNRSDDRAELLNKLRREALLKDASAALGRKDRVQTDKDGVDPKDAVIGPVGAGRMDPELARYVSQCRSKILPNWNPLPAILAAHPDYSVVVSVSVGANGALGKPNIIKTSTDASFDRSAISAVVRTGSLPAPPPRYAESAAKGVMITLSAADLR
jgi:colicin import membrane protein